ncbi:MAG: malto-oligosyltrehalose trehalohydrolase [Hyphomicrobiaceae bacterium]
MSAGFMFEKSWGPELLRDGRVRFRLWAPGQGSISVQATASGATEPMSKTDDGWFTLETRLLRANETYAFVLEDGTLVPDPAARAQAGDVHGPSRIVDPCAYHWKSRDWQGRPWSEAVIYELHTGTFSEVGTFAGVERKLDHLVEIGVTAVELMPVAQFSGNRGWGYDGVLLYAPHVAYGGPEGLKRLIDGAHDRGLMVLLDVVYNHFGPDGNYIHLYAPQFFDAGRQTPWGAAIDYSREPVRRFAIENALYWLEEYRFDGLRLDAVDQIVDPSEPHLLEELASEVRARITDRHVHLTTEDERNITRLHRRDESGATKLYTSEWNDDFHHVAHVLATGEADGYYSDYVDEPAAGIARALAEGFIYQGQASSYKDGRPRGEPSSCLPPLAFVNFLQNHDQIGNRAFGERLTTLASAKAVALLTAVLLLSPQVPLIYMGEEWGETRPFQFFTDFCGDLADAVREGRRNEFRKWRQFQDPAIRAQIPDPNALSTFDASRIDWMAAEREPHAGRLALVQQLLEARRTHLTPWLASLQGGAASARVIGHRAIRIEWRTSGLRYRLLANVSDAVVSLQPADLDEWRDGNQVIFELPEGTCKSIATGGIEAWSCVFTLDRASDAGSS